MKNCDYSYKYLFKITTFKLEESDCSNRRVVTIQIDF